MNTLKFRIVAVLAASTALGATIQCSAEETEKSVCEKKVLGHKGCEVGDFDKEKSNVPGGKKGNFQTPPARSDTPKQESPDAQSQKQQKILHKKAQ